MTKRYLAVVHQETSTTGRIGAAMAARGWTEVKRAPLLGEPLPEDPRSVDAVIVFGGPQSAYDPDPGIQAEHDYVARVMAAGVPFLGVCLGAQILASSLGARVAPHAGGHHEIGYFPIRRTAGANGLFPEEMHVYHWHGDGFELPRGATLLAEGGDAFPNQAFKANDRTFGIQFHPEVTGDMIEAWCREAPAEWRDRPGAQAPEDQRAGFAAHDARLGAWLEDFLDHWLERTQPL